MYKIKSKKKNSSKKDSSLEVVCAIRKSSRRALTDLWLLPQMLRHCRKAALAPSTDSLYRPPLSGRNASRPKTDPPHPHIISPSEKHPFPRPVRCSQQRLRILHGRPFLCLCLFQCLDAPTS
mmetsp:Transcript_4723/g.8116  ORF Transcript_4723/g.8116 Transcript_4723/m.8116 type:complete len:122 (-) Transcript_4723:138-503(-)